MIRFDKNFRARARDHRSVLTMLRGATFTDCMYLVQLKDLASTLYLVGGDNNDIPYSVVVVVDMVTLSLSPEIHILLEATSSCQAAARFPLQF